MAALRFVCVFMFILYQTTRPSVSKNPCGGGSRPAPLSQNSHFSILNSPLTFPRDCGIIICLSGEASPCRTID